MPPPPSHFQLGRGGGGGRLKILEKHFSVGGWVQKKLFWWFGGCIKRIFTFQNNQLNILQVHQKYPLFYQVYHIKIFSMCISFTFCLFPVEEGSKTFGDLGEFNSMRTGGVTVFFLGVGGQLILFEARGQYTNTCHEIGL